MPLKFRLRTMRKVDAIILAGGVIGKNNFPKALIAASPHQTVLEKQIEWLSPIVDRIIIACQEYESEQIKKYLQLGGNFVFSIEREPLGTAGALKKALQYAKRKDVIVCNVDDITNIDVYTLLDFGSNTICITNPRLPFGVIESENQDIVSFREKPLLKEIWVSCGVYLINKKIRKQLPDKGSLERDFFPFFKLKAYKHYGIWKTFSLQKIYE
jgi:NDP-sugar pyrophosphorylase family protein